ncbi:MAG: hypothetical protein KQA41_01015 [Candidatus Aenigmarchaeota archaeon]|nr:hypothetical protein [Candidatus Aenigmarchaeota archaeon]MBU5688795.1 hypothetical protein [Candidatus Aenigmarchaeota archaeon]
MRVGEVLSIKDNKAIIKTEFGIKEYKTDFVKKLRVGDRVIVHYDFIVEKFTKKIEKDLKEMKPIL